MLLEVRRVIILLSLTRICRGKLLPHLAAAFSLSVACDIYSHLLVAIIQTKDTDEQSSVNVERALQASKPSVRALACCRHHSFHAVSCSSAAFTRLNKLTWKHIPPGLFVLALPSETGLGRETCTSDQHPAAVLKAARKSPSTFSFTSSARRSITLPTSHRL